jgi:hypothetical protein
MVVVVMMMTRVRRAEMVEGGAMLILRMVP